MASSPSPRAAPRDARGHTTPLQSSRHDVTTPVRAVGAKPQSSGRPGTADPRTPASTADQPAPPPHLLPEEWTTWLLKVTSATFGTNLTSMYATRKSPVGANLTVELFRDAPSSGHLDAFITNPAITVLFGLHAGGLQISIRTVLPLDVGHVKVFYVLKPDHVRHPVALASVKSQLVFGDTLAEDDGALYSVTANVVGGLLQPQVAAHVLQVPPPVVEAIAGRWPAMDPVLNSLAIMALNHMELPPPPPTMDTTAASGVQAMLRYWSSQLQATVQSWNPAQWQHAAFVQSSSYWDGAYVSTVVAAIEHRLHTLASLDRCIQSAPHVQQLLFNARALSVPTTEFDAIAALLHEQVLAAQEMRLLLAPFVEHVQQLLAAPVADAPITMAWCAPVLHLLHLASQHATISFNREPAPAVALRHCLVHDVVARIILYAQPTMLFLKSDQPPEARLLTAVWMAQQLIDVLGSHDMPTSLVGIVDILEQLSTLVQELQAATIAEERFALIERSAARRPKPFAAPLQQTIADALTDIRDFSPGACSADLPTVVRRLVSENRHLIADWAANLAARLDLALNETLGHSSAQADAWDYPLDSWAPTNTTKLSGDDGTRRISRPSVLPAIHMLLAFDSILLRPELEARLAAMAERILDAVNSELAFWKAKFQTEISAALVSPFHAYFSGRLMWAYSLLSRIDDLISAAIRLQALVPSIQQQLQALADQVAQLAHDVSAFAQELAAAWHAETADTYATMIQSRVLTRMDLMAVVFQAQESELIEAFKATDSDGSAHIELDEFSQLLRRLGIPLAGSDLSAAFRDADSDGDGLVGFEDFVSWWKGELAAARKAFNDIDTDKSGRIDIYEFSSLLQRWQVRFSAAQFQVVMHQLSSEPEELSVTFQEFVSWWTHFVSHSAKSLLSANLERSTLQLLSEARTFGMLVPPSGDATPPGTTAMDFVASHALVQSQKSILDTLISLYNGMRITLMPAEYELFRESLAYIDRVLQPLIDNLTWDSSSHKTSLSALLETVRLTAGYVANVKSTMLKIDQAAAKWQSQFELAVGDDLSVTPPLWNDQAEFEPNQPPCRAIDIDACRAVINTARSMISADARSFSAWLVAARPELRNSDGSPLATATNKWNDFSAHILSVAADHLQLLCIKWLNQLVSREAGVPRCPVIYTVLSLDKTSQIVFNPGFGTSVHDTLQMQQVVEIHDAIELLMTDTETLGFSGLEDSASFNPHEATLATKAMLVQSYVSTLQQLSTFQTWCQHRFGALWTDGWSLSDAPVLSQDMLTHAQDLLQRLHALQSDAHTLPPLCRVHHCVIDMQAFLATCSTQVKLHQHNLVQQLGDLIAAELATAHTSVHGLSAGLQALLGSTTTSVDVAMARVQHTMQTETAWMAKVDVFDAGLNLLHAHDAARAAAGRNVLEDVSNGWRTLASVRSQVVAGLRLQRHQRIDELRAQELIWANSVDAFAQSFDQAAPITLDLGARTSYRMLDALHHKLCTYKQEGDTLQQQFFLYEATPGAPSTKGAATIAAFQRRLALLKHAWDIVATLEGQLNTWHGTPWDAMDVDAAESRATNDIKWLNELDREALGWPLCVAITDLFAEFTAICPIVAEFQTGQLQDSHWQQIADCLGISADELPYFTVQQLLAAGVRQHAAAVSQVLVQAQQQFRLQQLLQDVSRVWSAAELQFDLVSLPSDSVAALPRLLVPTELALQLEDHLVRLTAAEANPAAAQQPELREWKVQLHDVDATLKLWLQVQSLWHLAAAIAGPTTSLGEQLRQSYPVQLDHYDRTHEQLVATWHVAQQAPNALQCCTDPSRKLVLQDALLILETLRRLVEECVDSKRVDSPRLFFLSREEAATVFGVSPALEAINRLVGALFDGVCGVTAQGSRIVAVHIDAQDALPLRQSVDLMLPFQLFIRELEVQIHAALQFHMLDEQQPASLLSCHPLHVPTSQIAQVLANVHWSQEMHDALSDTSVDKLRGVLHQVTEHIRALTAELVKRSSQASQRSKLSSFLIELARLRDVTTAVEQARPESPLEFVWTSVLRFVRPGPRSLAVVCESFCTRYGYEPISGVGASIVHSALGARCILAITQALRHGFGASLAGASGSGKASLLQYVARFTGHMFHPVALRADLSVDIMLSRFKACIGVGAWLCCSSIDSLTQSATMTFATCAHELLAANRNIAAFTESASPPTDHHRLLLAGSDVMLHPHGCPLLLTGGKAGADRLPGLPTHLSNAFRPVSIISPDAPAILSVLLAVHGLDRATSTARKLVTLFELLKASLSRSAPCDFSLRSQLHICKCICDALITAAGLDTKVNTDHVVGQTICAWWLPKLSATDRTSFATSFAAVFGHSYAIPDAVLSGEAPGTLSAEPLMESVRQATLAVQQFPCPKFLVKAVELAQSLASHATCFVIGPSRSGKSSVVQIAAAALGCFCPRLFPNAATAAQWIGTVTAARGWQPGLLPTAIMSATQQPAWIHFDGPFDGHWSASLKAALDGDRQLVLPAGDVLTISQSCKFVIECIDIAQLDPAVLAQTAVVCVDRSSIGWQFVADAWLFRRLPAALHVYIETWLEAWLAPALEGDLATQVEGGQVRLVESVLSIFDGLLTADAVIPATLVVPSSTLVALLTAYFAFSVVWGVGALLSNVERKQFDKRIRHKWPSMPWLCSADLSVFDVVVLPKPELLDGAIDHHGSKQDTMSRDLPIAVPWKLLMGRSLTGHGLQVGATTPRDQFPWCPFAGAGSVVPHLGQVFVPSPTFTAVATLAARLVVPWMCGLQGPSQFVQDTWRPRSVIVAGPSGCGKTVFTRSLAAAITADSVLRRIPSVSDSAADERRQAFNRQSWQFGTSPMFTGQYVGNFDCVATQTSGTPATSSNSTTSDGATGIQSPPPTNVVVIKANCGGSASWLAAETLARCVPVSASLVEPKDRAQLAVFIEDYASTSVVDAEMTDMLRQLVDDGTLAVPLPSPAAMVQVHHCSVLMTSDNHNHRLPGSAARTAAQFVTLRLSVADFDSLNEVFVQSVYPRVLHQVYHAAYAGGMSDVVPTALAMSHAKETCTRLVAATVAFVTAMRDALPVESGWQRLWTPHTISQVLQGVLGGLDVSASLHPPLMCQLWRESVEAGPLQAVQGLLPPQQVAAVLERCMTQWFQTSVNVPQSDLHALVPVSDIVDAHAALNIVDRPEVAGWAELRQSTTVLTATSGWWMLPAAAVAVDVPDTPSCGPIDASRMSKVQHMLYCVSSQVPRHWILPELLIPPQYAVFVSRILLHLALPGAATDSILSVIGGPGVGRRTALRLAACTAGWTLHTIASSVPAVQLSGAVHAAASGNKILLLMMCESFQEWTAVQALVAALDGWTPQGAGRNASELIELAIRNLVAPQNVGGHWASAFYWIKQRLRIAVVTTKPAVLDLARQQSAPTHYLLLRKLQLLWHPVWTADDLKHLVTVSLTPRVQAVQVPRLSNIAQLDGLLNALEAIATQVFSGQGQQPEQMHAAFQSWWSAHARPSAEWLGDISAALSTLHSSGPSAGSTGSLQQLCHSCAQVCTLVPSLIQRIQQDADRHLCGLAIVKATMSEVADMKDRLAQAEADVATAVAEATHQRSVLQAQTTLLDEQAAIAASEQLKFQDMELRVSAAEKRATAQLQAAEAYLAQAEAALSLVDKAALIELKSFTNPAKDVITVMAGVSCLMAGYLAGHPVARSDWNENKAYMLGRVDLFLQALHNFKEGIDQEQVPTANFSAVRDFLDPRTSPEAIMRKSVAAAALCNWTRAIVSYYDVFMLVKPHRTAVDTARKELAYTSALVKASEEKLSQLQTDLSRTSEEYNAAAVRKQEAQQAAAALASKLNCSQRLIAALESEVPRWRDRLQNCCAEAAHVVADAVLTAIGLCYATRLSEAKRSEACTTKWLPVLTANGLHASREWTISGLTRFLMPRRWQVSAAGFNSAVSGELLCAITLAAQSRQVTVIHTKANVGPPLSQGLAKFGRPSVMLRASEASVESVLMTCATAGNVAVCIVDTPDVPDWVPAMVQAVTEHESELPFAAATAACGAGFGIVLVGSHIPFYEGATHVIHADEAADSTHHWLSRLIQLLQPELEHQSQELGSSYSTQSAQLVVIEEQLLQRLTTSIEGSLDLEDMVSMLESTRLAWQSLQHRITKLRTQHNLMCGARDALKPVAAAIADVETVQLCLSTLNTWYELNHEQLEAVVDRVVYAAARRVRQQPTASMGGSFSVSRANVLRAGSSKGSMRSVPSAASWNNGLGFSSPLAKRVVDTLPQIDAQEVSDDDEDHDADEAHFVDSSTVRAWADSETIGRLVHEVRLQLFSHLLRGCASQHRAVLGVCIALRGVLGAGHGAVPPELSHLLGTTVGHSAESGMHAASIIGEARRSNRRLCPFDWMPDDAWRRVRTLGQLACCATLASDILNNSAKWRAWFESDHPELEPLPQGWDSKPFLQQMCALQALRPDRLQRSMLRLIRHVLGADFASALTSASVTSVLEDALQDAAGGWKLALWLRRHVDIRPLLEVAAQSLNLRRDLRVQVVHHHVDAPANEQLLESLLSVHCRQACWFVVSNAHSLSAQCLATIAALQGVHEDFRLLVVVEPPITESLAWLTRRSVHVVLEEEPDFRTSVSRAMSQVETLEADVKDDDDSMPGLLWQRIKFALIWLHACVCGRQEYGRLGWLGKYRFSGVDLEFAVKLFRQVLVMAGQTGYVAWNRLQAIVCDVVYGGHVANSTDAQVLRSLTTAVLCPSLVASESFVLVPPSAVNKFPGVVLPPLATPLSALSELVRQLPADNPLLLRLRPQSVGQHNAGESQRMLHTIQRFKVRLGVVLNVSETSEPAAGAALDVASHLIADMPGGLDDGTGSDGKSIVTSIISLLRFADFHPSQWSFIQLFCDEVKAFYDTFETVKAALVQLVNVEDLSGIVGDVAHVADALGGLRVPRSWNNGVGVTDLATWWTRFHKQSEQLRQWLAAIRKGQCLPTCVWLPALARPEALVCALRLNAAQCKGNVGIETLFPIATLTAWDWGHVPAIKPIPPHEPVTILIAGVQLVSAHWNASSGLLETGESVANAAELLPVLRLQCTANPASITAGAYLCPVHTDTSRVESTSLFSIPLPTSQPSETWVQYGAAAVLHAE